MNTQSKNIHAVALGRRGGKAGTGESKARTSEQARAASLVYWSRFKHMRKSKYAVTPLFSEEDADLNALLWRTERWGYCVTSRIDPEGKTRPIKAHRIVLERMTGRSLTSSEIVDHINGVKTDNRRDNLRIVSAMGNAQHKHTLSKGDIVFRGTYFKHGKWRARVQHKKVEYTVPGGFATREEAALAAAAKRQELGFL